VIIDDDGQLICLDAENLDITPKDKLLSPGDALKSTVLKPTFDCQFLNQRFMYRVAALRSDHYYLPSAVIRFKAELVSSSSHIPDVSLLESSERGHQFSRSNNVR
jgi:hypothetical protein